MAEQWVGAVIGEMHMNRIKQVDLAKAMDVTPEYLNAILNGKRSPVGAEQRIRSALDNLIFSQHHNDTTSPIR